MGTIFDARHIHETRISKVLIYSIGQSLRTEIPIYEMRQVSII